MRSRLLGLAFIVLAAATGVAIVLFAESARQTAPGSSASGPTVVRRETATIAAVEEGLTLRLADGGRVRLLGLELPTAPAHLPRAATEAVRALAEGQPVFLERDEAAPDSGDLPARHVFLADGRSLQAELIRAGYARLDPAQPSRYEAWLRGEQERAQRARLGLWQFVQPATATPLPVAPTPPAETVTPFVCGPAAANEPNALDAETARRSNSITTATVVFTVVSATGRGDEIYLNAAMPPRGHFRVVIPAEVRARFSGPPERLFVQRCIAVRGRLRPGPDAGELLLGSPDDIRTIR